MDIYNLKCISEHIYDVYECFTNFSFMDNNLNVEILTRNGKKYSFSYSIILGDSADLQQWLNSISEQFNKKLVDEALGKEQYYNDNVRDYDIRQLGD